ncbi:MAG TPA: pyrroloquinoline quinone biosynthesis peptide chaperone PqqD [Alphaproteobacteria bacterium]
MSARVEIGGASVPRLPQHVKLRYDETRKQWVILAPERVLVPDEIALEILRLCDGVASVSTIVDMLAAKFATPRAEIAGDVQEMLQDLADKGMVVA